MELELRRLPGPGGLTVVIVIFGDDGWEAAKERWNDKYSEESLADAIEGLSLPRPEAEGIARSTLEQWRSNGWEQAQQEAAPRVIPVLVSTFGLAAIGVVAIVVAVILLLL
jgi:hypothetical protein